MESIGTIERPAPGKPPEAARILVTDDRPECLRLIDRSLGGRYSCEFAGDSAQARRHLAEHEFDLALCDIEMPGESGLELARHIAAQHPLTAVVLVTGVDDPEVAEAAFEFGAHGYLVKPFWPGQLLITVMNALERRSLEIAQRAHSAALEDRLQSLMDRAPVPIYIKDAERRYAIANRVAHEVAGVEPGTLIGLRDADIMPAEAERKVAESDRRILKHGETYEAEESLVVGGEARAFCTVKFPFVDDSGQIAGISGISTDITAKKQAADLQIELTRAQKQAISELSASRLETVDRLARAIEHHDSDTGLHISRMAAVAAHLAKCHGFPADRVELLRAAAPMHDVGKVATPDAILRKPGSLTAEERMVMEQHTMVGYEILADSDSDLLQLGASIALTHHERWDGDGYPQGLREEQIPIEGRIVALADVFDALLSDRSYRPAIPVDDAIAMITYERARHFDPHLVDLLFADVPKALSLRG